jgi:TonB family protein
VPRNRRYRQGWIIGPTLLCSAALQGGALAAYEALKPEPPPHLTVNMTSRSKVGGDVVLISDAQGQKLRGCDGTARCRIDAPRGTVVTLDAIPGEKSTFTGWEGCTPAEGDVLRCTITLDADVAVAVSFGALKDEVNVAMVEQPAAPDLVALPDPLAPLAEPPRPPTPEEIEAEKLEEAPVEVAIVPPLPPEQLPPPKPKPPEPPPPPPEAAKPPPPMPDNMRMVEVPDENEVEKAPDDATHLSDKNRDVAEETRATETNLEEEKKGEAIASAESDDTTSKEIGGAEDEIAQNEDSEATTDERVETSDRSGAEEVAKGTITGEEGDDGEEGDGGEKEPGVMAMRGVEGRGRVADQGGDGKRSGKKGTKGAKLRLEFEDYERIVGTEKAEEERLLAKRKRSHKKGRYTKRLEAIKSALENFTPDVRPGNQTALKTRAHPFALYVTRMHRRIHELWGFGFLEDLDRKSSNHELNDFDLFVAIEVAINPDGSVHKTTIAKTSGQLEFDVAALDTILAAGPYEETPDAIRSVDHRVYLRWGFYRNWRQCGTFNVEPYILTDIPGGIEPLAEGTEGGKARRAARGDAPITPDPSETSGAAGAAHGEGDGHDHGDHDVGDRELKYAANMWVAGFSSASIDRMLKVSAVPFYGGTEVAASSAAELRQVYEGMLVEAGPMKDWEVVTPAQYGERTGSPVELPAGAMVVLVKTAKDTFGVVLVKTKSGEFRANAVLR